MKVKIYIEGGGDSREQDDLFRAAWRAFFEKAGLKRMPATFRGSGRDQAFKAYCNAVANPKPGELPLLLVDSEDLVTKGSNAWAHLKARDKWNKPAKVGATDAFLMICCMETWFVADRATLKGHYPKLIEKHLKAWPDLEKVPKDTIMQALEQATAKHEKPYTEKAKGDAGFKLLAKIRPDEVAKHCASAALLLERLRKLLK